MSSNLVQQLGETEVLLPARVAEGLAANDRAKARLSALQAVAKQATHPAEEPEDLSAECASAGLDASAIRAMAAAAHATSPGRIAAPGLARLIRSLFDDVGAMVAAVAAGGEAAGSTAANRLSALRGGLSAEYDEIEVARITELAALPAGRRQPASPRHGSAQGAEPPFGSMRTLTRAATPSWKPSACRSCF